MATESPAAQGLTDDVWLNRALPIIRVGRCRLLPLADSDVVIALYCDSLVIKRKRKSIPIPGEAYEPGGSEALRGARGRTISIPLDEIRSMSSTPRSIVGQYDELRISGKSSIRLRIDPQETPHLYRALGLLLGPRFRERRRPPFGSALSTVVLLAMLAGSIVATFSPAARVLGPVLWVATAGVAVIGTLRWIPARRAESLATELPATEPKAQPLSDDVWLSRTLPVIRVRNYRFPPFVDSTEVVALYADALVIKRKWKWVPIPEEAYEPGGAETLRAVRGRTISIPLEKIRRLTSTPRPAAGRYDSLRVSGVRSGRARVDQEETPNLYRALRLLLGPRFQERKWRPPFGSGLLTIVLAVVLAGAAIGTFTEALPILKHLVSWLWVASAAVAVIGTIRWFPGRLRPPRREKTKPSKDLSGRQPLRLRVAGFAISAMGSLFMVYYFIDLLAKLGLPLLFLSDRGWVLQRWYLSIGWLAGLLFLIVLTGGSAAGSRSVGPLTLRLFALSFFCSFGVAVYELVQKPSVQEFYDLLWGVSPYVGLALIHTGRRLISRNAFTVVEGDPRAPILYLRSFEDDVEDTLTPHTQLARFLSLTLPTTVRRLPMWLRVLYEIQPLRLVRSLFGRVTATTELQLAAYFHKFGPFIAIGKPGERLATPGADRKFVKDGMWQDEVRNDLNRSRWVVVQAAGTKGLLWEVHTVLSEVDPRKILFCLGSFRGRQNDYEDFRREAEAVGGWRLPRSVGNQDETQFLYFEADRTPVLRAASYRSPALWPVLSNVTDLEHTLAGFVERDRPPSAPYKPRSYPGRGLLALFFTLVIGPLAGAVLLYLVLLAAGHIVPANDAGPSVAPRPISPLGRSR